MNDDETDEPGIDWNDFYGDDDRDAGRVRPQPTAQPQDNAPKPLAVEPAVLAEPRLSPGAQPCVMLGPARSGKTTLLTAIKRACDQPANDHLDLEFIPGPETAKKIKEAINKIVERKRGHEATTNVGSYSFEVH